MPRKNEVLVATRIWPQQPDYNAVALTRYFAIMKALEPQYKQDDEVAYTWGTKSKSRQVQHLPRVVRGGREERNREPSSDAKRTGCQRNPRHHRHRREQEGTSSSSDPKHLNDILELFKKQAERAKANIPKG